MPKIYKRVRIKMVHLSPIRLAWRGSDGLKELVAWCKKSRVGSWGTLQGSVPQPCLCTKRKSSSWTRRSSSCARRKSSSCTLCKKKDFFLHEKKIIFLHNKKKTFFLHKKKSCRPSLLLVQEEDFLLVQEENKEWSPESAEKLKIDKNILSQNCPGTFGVSFAIITGT